jgi:hypothetical protein
LLLTDCTHPSLENLERLLPFDSSDETDRFRSLNAVDRPVCVHHVFSPAYDVAFWFAANYQASFLVTRTCHRAPFRRGSSAFSCVIERSQDEIAAKLSELKALIGKGDLKPWEFQGLKAIWFGRHLYEPLLYLDQKIVEISPVPLNKGERQFVEDLKVFHDNDGEFLAEKQFYLLRNLSKGGVGFFEAGNFHPDFILWLLIGSEQHVIFVDPKGIRHLGPTDPKIQFYTTIKEIEQRLGDTGAHLHSFIHSLEYAFAYSHLPDVLTKRPAGHA